MNALAFRCVCAWASQRERYGVLFVWVWSEGTWWRRKARDKERELKSLLHLFYHMDKGNGEDGQAFRFLRASIKTSFEHLTCSLRRLKLPSISFSTAEYSFSFKSSGMYLSVLSPMALSLMSKKILPGAFNCLIPFLKRGRSFTRLCKNEMAYHHHV